MALATAGAVAAKSVASGAAAKAATTLGKGLAKKGAAEVGKGMVKMADGSRDFLAASMAFQQVGNAFKVTGPAMSLVAAQFTSGTMEARIQLMESLLNMVQSPGFEAFMKNFTDFVSYLMSVATKFVDLITDIGNKLEPLRSDINKLFSDIATKFNEVLNPSAQTGNKEVDRNIWWLNWIDFLNSIGIGQNWR